MINLVLFYKLFLKDLKRRTRRHIRQLVGNFWSAVLVQNNLKLTPADGNKLQCMLLSHFTDNVTQVYPKNSCKLVGKSLIIF